MSTWNSALGIVQTWPPERDAERPDWWAVDCGCCNGLQWGGEEPMECRTCNGSGALWVHRPSGVMACWPGGPLNGKAWPSLLAEIDAHQATLEGEAQ